MGMGSRKLLMALLLSGLTLGTIPICLAEGAPRQLSLEQAVRIALVNNLQRRLAQGELEVARDKRAQAASGYLPKVTLSGGYNRLNEIPDTVELARSLAQLNNGLDAWSSALASSDPRFTVLANNLNQVELLSDSLDYYGLKLHVEQPLYTGNKLTALNKQAGYNEEYARANLMASENNLALEVKRAYFTVLLAQRMAVTLDEAVIGMEHHLAEANSYLKAGMVPKLDVMRAEVRLADLRQKQLLAHNSLTLAKTAFNFVLGVDLGAEFVLEERLDYSLPAGDLRHYLERAVTNRPELTAIKARVEMARQAVALAKSANKPVVALVADGQTMEPITPSPSITVGVMATMKLYDGGLVKNQIAEAEATLQQAITGKDLLEQGIRLEVEQAYRNLQVALESVKVAEKSLDQARETLRMAEVSYKAGLSSSLERIDAEIGLTQAKTNHTQALSMAQIALAQLERATGTSKEESK
jgi:outer membrane protein